MSGEKPRNLFEQAAIRQVTGDTIRPGGLALTDHALVHCRLPEGARVLDVGCGAGATVEHLSGTFDAVGLDPSEALLAAGRTRAPDLRLVRGRGEDLPFAPGTFDAVLAECVLSLIPDLNRALAAFSRVLRAGGYLVISDMHARRPAGAPARDDLPIATCLGSALSPETLIPALSVHGLAFVLMEDHTRALADLAARIIFEYGSLGAFWACAAGEGAGAMQNAVAGAKPGYILLIARKEKKSA
ncbi:MAG TPA: class I SAM-dependent methyltransferase [Aggregatilinea sp.]|uniref:DVU_1556 family methyltransferase n=1 Tax=Aggregatilinea sp. TaxID=2806333 RepID=UPI002BA64C51|nr:class I SAM-dependent methyltransferase [Aggregatilinea sp.]HML24683.1 class I SAM-dependent methyltransferase [Aggregatilinea sp.]